MLGTRSRVRRPTSYGAATRACIMHDPARGTNCIYATRSSSIATLFRPESRNARNLVSWFSGKLLKFVATRCQILRLKCTRFDFGWGSAPDPAGGAYSSRRHMNTVVKHSRTATLRLLTVLCYDSMFWLLTLCWPHFVTFSFYIILYVQNFYLLWSTYLYLIKYKKI